MAGADRATKVVAQPNFELKPQGLSTGGGDVGLMSMTCDRDGT